MKERWCIVLKLCKKLHQNHLSSAILPSTHQPLLALIDGHLTMTVNTTYSSCIYVSDASCNIYSPRFYKLVWHAWGFQCTSVTAIKKLQIMLLLHSCIQCNTYHNEPERDGPCVIVQKGPDEPWHTIEGTECTAGSVRIAKHHIHMYKIPFLPQSKKVKILR